MTFVIAPQNVLEIVVSGPDFAAWNFIGFDAKTSQYWRTEMGVFGGILRETSSDGVNFSGVNFGGPQTKGSAPFPIRSVMTVATDGRSSDLTEQFPESNRDAHTSLYAMSHQQEPVESRRTAMRRSAPLIPSMTASLII